MTKNLSLCLDTPQQLLQIVVIFTVLFTETMADADNGDYQGGPGGGDGANVPTGSVALLSDPVDVIIDKLLRYVCREIRNHGQRNRGKSLASSSVPASIFLTCKYDVLTAFFTVPTDRPVVSGLLVFSHFLRRSYFLF